MNEAGDSRANLTRPGQAPAGTPLAATSRTKWWVGSVIVATIAFAEPLQRLVSHSLANELHSHVPIVPLVVAFLLFEQARNTAAVSHRSSPFWALALFGVAVLAVSSAISFHDQLSSNDHLALMALAYLSFIGAGGFLFYGRGWMAAHAFPMAFLLFMIPLPDGAAAWLEWGSASASADVSAWLFRVSGTPLLHKGTLLELPGITLEVARECSGIRSSWVLFFTAVLVSRTLRSPWRRLLLIAVVVPLGILRNGFRILVIGLLCVNLGPHMIDSLIHRRGGPIFFALSLVPLFLLFLWLRRREERSHGFDVESPFAVRTPPAGYADRVS